jgi:CelD/BcsL family acetyltransferase involved in cellulose biosynthesis
MPETTFTTTTVSDEGSFAALGREWDDLVRAMPRPCPFFLHSWLTEWWRHYGEDRELAVHVAMHDGRLAAALPLCSRRRYGLRITEFVGGQGTALGDLLLAEGESEAAATAVAGQAAAADGHLTDLFGLPSPSRLVRALDGSDLHLLERIESPVLDLSSGWEAVYAAKTSSKKRNLHRRRRKQLESLGRLELSLARTPAELADAVEDAFRLHALRWAGRPDGSGFGTPVGMQFHRAALNALGEADVARIITLKLDGRAIAFHYYFALWGCMYVHRLAFDPAFSRYSPGLVTTLATLEAASAEGLTRVEFLGGAERYKAEIADHNEPLYQGIGLAHGPLGHMLLSGRLAYIRSRRHLGRSRLRRVYYEGFAPLRQFVSRSAHPDRG